jgi:gluconolactonase
MQNGLVIPGMEGEDLQRYLDWQGVFRLTPDGELKPMATDFSGPNGLAFSPDEKRLYVNDTAKAHIRAFDFDPDGNFIDRGVFYKLVGDEPGHADGMKVDTAGNLYCTGSAGVHVIAPDGTLLGRIHIPLETTNMAWGDEDWRSLYVTTHETIYRTRLKIPGIPVW